ncbi:MAG: ABC transporter permease [Chelatococcus sp.]|uniref:ABC transporter permease n=1 Tax=Chelatococcus sp. TaxID=1953771 RepID=UPI0025B8FD50|nr:ABC transporter permease [Chelatococcus sp.]MBX3540213.1 ABC transporter permease [Chelatococcus sp.]
MFSYFSRKLVQMLPVAFFVTVIVFALTNLLPGDPTVTILGEQATAEQRAAVRVEYGLDQPAPVRYVTWLGRVVQGDFGRSLRTREDVGDMLSARIPVTLELAFLSILIAVAIGVPAGIIAARFRGTLVDVMTSFLAMSSVAIPYFWMGILLIMLFSLKLGWLPASGYVKFIDDPAQNLRLMILPALTIGTAFAALVMRQTRASMLQILSLDYIRTARAKGLSELIVVLRHGLRNALIPVITVIGLQIGALLGGAVVTETVFALPGLGRMLVDGIFQRDFPVIQGAILFIVIAVFAVNLCTDFVYRILDPRVQV